MFNIDILNPYVVTILGGLTVNAVSAFAGAMQTFYTSKLNKLVENILDKEKAGSYQSFIMDESITRIQQKHGLSEEEVVSYVIGTLKVFDRLSSEGFSDEQVIQIFNNPDEFMAFFFQQQQSGNIPEISEQDRLKLLLSIFVENQSF